MYLGINGFSHDASACLIDEQGVIVAAIEEERFTGKKHEARFPTESIKFCLAKAGITTKDIKGIGYAWHPRALLFERVLWSNFFDYPVPFHYIKRNISKIINGINLRKTFESEIGPLHPTIKISYFKHHRTHAASAFYASPFDNAAFLTLDGRGEWETGTWGIVEKTNIQQKGRIHFPNSLGTFYVAVGHLCGYPTFHKAGTVMALAALGKPIYLEEFKKMISLDIYKNSDFLTITKGYVDSTSGEGVPTKKMEDLFGTRIVMSGEEPTQKHKDIAATLQYVVQNIILELLNKIQKQTGKKNIVLSGGVCLNSVTNGMIKEKTTFKDFFIQPAAHDAGLSLGAAYLMLHKDKKQKISPEMKTACLGPSYSDQEIEQVLSKNDQIIFHRCENVVAEVARLISEGKKICWFQGRMEYGPRALGCRSILCDARKSEVVGELNTIKSRETFRPFAISILEEKSKDWLVRGAKSPFMLLVDYVKEELKSVVPAAHHIDGSVRVQTVNAEDNGIYYDLIKEYESMTGVPMIINTSFNIKGQPIVRTPEDAIVAFCSVSLDVLAIGHYIVTKK